MAMGPRERVLRTLDFARPDRLPVFYHPSPAGLHTHGEKLLRLMNELPPDNPVVLDRVPHPPPEDRDPDGRYHSFADNGWGGTVERRIFGVAGHVCAWRHETWDEVRRHAPPEARAGDFAWIAETARTHVTLACCNSVLGRLADSRPFAEVLVALAEDDPGAVAMAEWWTDRQMRENRLALDAGADFIVFGDDYGQQRATLFSPRLFRRRILPCLERMAAPVRAAGRRVKFHCCGFLTPFLDDLLDLGVSLFWPQLSIYGEDEAFLGHLLERRVTLYLHPDRQWLVPLGTPARIDAYIAREADRYKRAGGGAILYAEIENDAPWENVEALIRAMHRYR